MSKAKTASKNNPTTREQVRKFYLNELEIRPVKLVTKNSTFFAAEFEGTGELVTGTNGVPLPWNKATNQKA